MAEQSIWDKYAAQGFYYNTNPKKSVESNEDLVHQPEKAIENIKKSSIVEKIVSSAFDLPVSISAKVGGVTGKMHQGVSSSIRSTISKIPGINKIDDGLKSLDDSKILNALSRGELPGGEAFANFTTDTKTRIEKIKEAPWIGKALKYGKYAIPPYAIGAAMKSIMPKAWDEIVDKITNQLVRNLLTEIADILIDWYKDPKTLCCLIKNLAALATMDNREKLYEGVDVREYLGSDYFKTKNILLQIRNYIDIIIEILSVDLSRAMDSFFDIGKEISDMIIGVMIGILSALKKIGEEAWYNKLREWVKDLGLTESDIQCLPLDQLMDALIRFFSSDHGLFNALERFIIEYTQHLKWSFIKNFKEKYINKTRDLQFLKFIRDLIDKIIDSLEHFEMCIEADYTSVSVPKNPLTNFNDSNSCPYGINIKLSKNGTLCDYKSLDKTAPKCKINAELNCIHIDAINDYLNKQTYNDDGNIGNIKGDYPGTQRKVGKKKVGDREEIAMIFPTDNEVRNFFINQLGYSKNQADQMITQSQVDNQESKIEVSSDTLSNLGVGDTSKETIDGRTVNKSSDYTNKRKELMSALGDCAKTLRPEVLADLANRLSDIY